MALKARGMEASYPSHTDHWHCPPRNVALHDNEVHVWYVPIDKNDTSVQRLQKTLSEDERIRADRFYFAQDRRRFIEARAWLRDLLSRYLRIAPARLSFRYNAFGKPRLLEEYAENIKFNLSHSHNVALYAITRNREVGIDVELMRPDVDYEQIAKRFFAPSEVAALREVPPSLRVKAFYRCWTRKEAYIKARGEGLSIPLDQFAVLLSPSDRESTVRIEGEQEESLRWSLYDLNSGPDYAASLAVEGHGWHLKCWRGPVRSANE